MSIDFELECLSDAEALEWLKALGLCDSVDNVELSTDDAMMEG